MTSRACRCTAAPASASATCRRRSRFSASSRCSTTCSPSSKPGPKLSRADRHDRAHDLLNRFGITKLAKSLAITLSGGEKRRLAIARSLCSDPKLLMLDEPFAGIDPIAVEDIQRIVRELRDRDGLAILITDHSVRETLTITDRAFLIHDGRVILEGASDELVNDPIARKHYLGDDFRM